MKTAKRPLPRLITPALLEALDRFPIVVLTGARQTGKTTLVLSPEIARDRLYRTLDDLEVLAKAEKQPDQLLEEAPRMTLDEVQRVPELLLAIKRAVDRDRTNGRFLLTGSANLLLMRRVSESLSGRAVYLHLFPMTGLEKIGSPKSTPWSGWLQVKSLEEAEGLLTVPHAPFDWADQVHVGGYPVSVLAIDRKERLLWYEGYLRTYLERDLQEVASISALADFHKLMKISALRVGQMLKQIEVARDAGVSGPTAHRYLNLLETSLQILRLPAFGVNRTKRLMKMPKLYWRDTGLAAYLAGLHDPRAVAESTMAGALVENLLLTELCAWRETCVPRPELFYWRTHNNEEVDFVIELGRRLLPIEVKLRSRVGPDQVEKLHVFLKEYDDLAPFGIVVYSGTEVYRVSRRILAVPLGSLLSDPGP